MKNEKIIVRLMWAFSMLPVLLTLIVFEKLPDQIPMHWNIHGEIDAWYSKFPWAFAIPLLGIIITVLISVLPKIDPKKENYEKFKPQYFIIRLFVIIFLAVMQIIIIFTSMGATFLKVDTIIKFLVGILFIILGNLMPKLKQNYFVGIKTPWTLANEVVWTKSHRHGGFVWFGTGFIMSGLAFVPGMGSSVVYFTLIFVSAIEPIIYSWIRFRKETK
ncbi:MAG: SdpI family protein [Clostridia bacterium]